MKNEFKVGDKMIVTFHRVNPGDDTTPGGLYYPKVLRDEDRSETEILRYFNGCLEHVGKYASDLDGLEDLI